MKIWRFYIKPQQNIDKRRYDLYAITNKKEYAETFMKTRNMNKFYTRCTKEDDETYKTIANDNLSCVLDMYDIYTRGVNRMGILIHTKINVLMTDYEYQESNGSDFQCVIMNDDRWWMDSAPYKIFNKKIIKALRTLEYVSFYKMFAAMNSTAYIDEQDDDFSAPDLWVDEFGAFIYLFGATFK